MKRKSIEIGNREAVVVIGIMIAMLFLGGYAGYDTGQRVSWVRDFHVTGNVLELRSEVNMLKRANAIAVGMADSCEVQLLKELDKDDRNRT